jgi:hypothetical protein
MISLKDLDGLLRRNVADEERTPSGSARRWQRAVFAKATVPECAS